jgi:hypothetical protein
VRDKGKMKTGFGGLVLGTAHEKRISGRNQDAATNPQQARWLGKAKLMPALRWPSDLRANIKIKREIRAKNEKLTGALWPHLGETEKTTSAQHGTGTRAEGRNTRPTGTKTADTWSTERFLRSTHTKPTKDSTKNTPDLAQIKEEPNSTK